MSKDPSGFGGGDNFYAYTDNDPVNYIDPEGEVRQKVGLPAPGIGDLTQGGFGGGGGYIGPVSGSAIAGALGSAFGDLCNDILKAFSKPEPRNPAQDKKLSEREGKRIDAEKIKRDVIGGKGGSRYDLFVDKQGNIYVKPKSGKGPGESTGLNINDF